jgi:hypothetical protein
MTTNRHVKLSAYGTPETSDVGRLWNEGLAFWGWWFYLSKFYEVLDTFIILAKGKPSSTLQTYHHTGAMACMWAGIRYMSPPIWMFCFLNSGVHALMVSCYRCCETQTLISRSTRTTRSPRFASGFHSGSRALSRRCRSRNLSSGLHSRRCTSFSTTRFRCPLRIPGPRL